MVRAGVDPPPRKMNTFFLESLALSVAIYRNFQSNGDNWRTKKLYNRVLHKYFFPKFETSPFSSI